MKDDWRSIFETDQLFQAERIKSILSDNGIEAVILNQKDSSYIMLGTIKVMVDGKDREKAAEIIKSANCE